MKGNLVLIVIWLLLGCSVEESKIDKPQEIPSTLMEMVNRDLDSHLFYEVFPDKFTKKETFVLFIMPSSSCFNCFEELTEELGKFYKEVGLKNIIFVRNDNIKDREVRFSLQNVVSIENIEILNIKDLDFIKSHEFFPKLGFVKNGNLSCVEIFEQGDIVKISNYFEFLKIFL
ncbi:hypothetical protein [Algoriphagus boritolerans]|uniref:AhpC/TSA family protein n=1 Tax=Algoriphagus boritolerans DSM 17298 = JCM 18970 TaxID=1120964 RepID=A0A1H5UGY9_9BACT|nr:hypothetical protein [Algoriphagus boritolerans]SEF74315.1 hypothetical protein SAMN03080598_01267 [Algoriphagus boritolerans DSM 17298 = JCM 18970]